MQVLDRKVFHAGQMVFKQGEEGRYAYLVEKGVIEIVQQGPEGHERVLGRVGSGGIFGEMALIDDQPRMAAARAAEESVLVQINRQSFRQRIERCDPLIRGLLNIFVKNIRALTAPKPPT